MDFLELVNTRYAVRSYTGQPVEADKLAKILEAGRMAPTGGNLQPQRLVVVRQPEGLQKLSKAANLYGAPLAIIVCTDTTKTWTRPQDGKKLTDIDASIVTDHMMLQATELGLASVWVCWFDAAELRKQFALPEQWEPVNILALGYGAEPAKPAEQHSAMRKPLQETVWEETGHSIDLTGKKRDNNTANNYRN